MLQNKNQKISTDVFMGLLDSPEKLAEYLMQLRYRSGLSVDDVAKKMGCSEQVIHALENTSEEAIMVTPLMIYDYVQAVGCYESANCLDTLYKPSPRQYKKFGSYEATQEIIELIEIVKLQSRDADQRKELFEQIISLTGYTKNNDISVWFFNHEHLFSL